MKSRLIHRIPPRPTFDKDMTEAEGSLMEQHFAYWKDLNEKGICFFGGPVPDPKGVYGILVVRAASEDEARALGSADPSVKAGLNKIDAAEIRVVFVPAHPSQAGSVSVGPHPSRISLTERSASLSAADSLPKCTAQILALRREICHGMLSAAQHLIDVFKVAGKRVPPGAHCFLLVEQGQGSA